MRQNFIVISTRRSPESVRPPLTLHRRVMSPHHHTASFRLFAPSPMRTSSLAFANFRISCAPQSHFQLIFWRTMWTCWSHSSLNYSTGRCHPGCFHRISRLHSSPRYCRSHLMGSHIDLYWIKSNQIKWLICSAQHAEKQRPAAHYNNKIHVDKNLYSLMFILKRTAKKVSLQLSFESSGGNSLSEWGWEIVPNSWTSDRKSTVTQSCTCALYSGFST